MWYDASVERTAGAIFILTAFSWIFVNKNFHHVSGFEGVNNGIDLSTATRFSEQVRTKKTAIPYKTVYENDNTLEFGKQNVKQEGEEGLREDDYKTLYYDGKFYSEDLVDTRIVPVKNKVISKGTKEVLKVIQTESGSLTTYGGLRVWATSYDKNCLGCNEWTATGKHLEKGIIAVDPKVIPLHTKIYVPGYGVGVAEDVGGAIKGNKIDLGFYLLDGSWSSRWVDIYFIK